MNYFKLYIYLIILIKLIFIILSVTHVYLKANKKEKSNLDKNIVFIKDRIEFIFVLLMSILLIFLFNPRTSNSVVIAGEPKLLLYLFGFILLITADWKNFIYKSIWFEKLQEIIGK